MVFEILSSSDLDNYYCLNEFPGAKNESIDPGKYDFLTDPQIISSLVQYQGKELTRVTFDIPTIHCSSCIWLLERLHKLNTGIISSTVNFPKKQIMVSFDTAKYSLKELVILLASIGYKPDLNLSHISGTKKEKSKSLLTIQLGVAGFCFGNIMLFSFPEYLSLGIPLAPEYSMMFSYLNIGLSLPIVFFSAKDYFISAFKSLHSKSLSIDVPIALGASVLFIRSVIDIIFYNQAGYLDSLAGLIFFLLIGKWFQNKTYQSISFDRDYKSYFPISVSVKRGKTVTNISLSNLKIGDTLLIRNNELIPADSILQSDNALIDFSFVTGEAEPIQKNKGDLIYAGGKLHGTHISVKTIKDVSQSYLTQLWNEVSPKHKIDKNISHITNTVSRYFTPTILAISLIAAIAWWFIDKTQVINVFTTILIIACPCALALTVPFTYGNALRILGKKRIYLKHANVVEAISKIDTIVFDKTGTLMINDIKSIVYAGDSLSEKEKAMVHQLTQNSIHPQSIAISRNTPTQKSLKVDLFEETIGMGIKGNISGNSIKIGSTAFLNANNVSAIDNNINGTWLCINNEVKGQFIVKRNLRKGLKNMFRRLKNKYHLHLLSGDNDTQKDDFDGLIRPENLVFNQSPSDKLDYVSSLKNLQKNVLMVGDGLNDAGALLESQVGMAVTDETNQFSPACDVIIEGDKLKSLPNILAFCKRQKWIVYAGFVISIAYNIIGLSFALQGLLSPIIAAILMPLSSITVVLACIFLSQVTAHKYRF